MEKVWKAEQRDEQERKKIDQLQQEIREERAREEMHKAAVDSGIIKYANYCTKLRRTREIVIPRAHSGQNSVLVHLVKSLSHKYL